MHNQERYSGMGVQGAAPPAGVRGVPATFPFPKAGIISLLMLIGLLLLLFTGLLILDLPQALTKPGAPVSTQTQQPSPTATQEQAATATATPPIFPPGIAVIPPLQLPPGHAVIYEQQNKLYSVPATGGSPQMLSTPGYIYNEAVRPILTPSGQVLYSGDGLWLIDVSSGVSTRIASLAPNQVITSMAMSNDGTMIAWSTEPINGAGPTDLYAGPLTAPTLVYQQSAMTCPCFRIFSFLNGSAKQADTTLLLTDDRGSKEAVQNGLWSLDLTATPPTPQLLLDEDPQQGPLALAPVGNMLLYSSNEGVVPIPADRSVPPDIAALPYANSLDVTALGGQPLALGTPQVILPEQSDLNNSADYHWVTTPVFAPNGRTLVYVEFSSDAHYAYDRHSALYTVQISGSGTHFHVGKPQLLATSTALLLELGVWLNNSILSFYADGALYALDIHTGAVTTILQIWEPSATLTESYARIVAVVGTGQV